MKTWDEVVEKFLKKYFPESKTAEGTAAISSFHQFHDESLSEALERFRGLLRKTPTHGFSEPIQLNMCIEGLILGISIKLVIRLIFGVLGSKGMRL